MLTIETTSDFSAEKEYCFHVLFREMLGAEYQVVSTLQPGYRIRLPNGNVLILEDHFFNNLGEPGYGDAQHLPPDVHVGVFQGVDFLSLYGISHVKEFLTEEKQTIHCAADLIASTFFMLSRWEETVVNARDKHGRFPASASASVRLGFLDRPVVNEWADLLYAMLRQLGWQQTRPERIFQISVSCDVDHPRLWWSVWDRFKTLVGSLFVRLDRREARFWLRHHFFKTRDPYDVFDEWMDIFEQHGLRAYFNFLGDRLHSSDCYYPVEHPFVRNLIEKLAKRGHIIGFHPSYEAFDDPEKFKHELNSVREISPVPVTTGRQHYLRFSVPYTWKIWDWEAMEWDSTLGYSEMEGFRCGICHDYPVFDLIEKKIMPLREKPLIAMDVTLALYRQYTPEQALERLLYLKQQVIKHRGEFVFLWHNSSWNTYFWAPWKKVFLQFLST